MTEEPDDWNEHERALLDALEPAEAPPPELERRIVAALKARGLIRARPARVWRSAAAALAALAVGVGLGRASAGIGRAPATPSRMFVLLLYPGAGLDPSPAAESDRVQEYRLWAQGLAAQGRMVRGEKLKDGARVFGAETRDATALQGFFLIRAGTLEEAEAIARTCPHRDHGGTIALREVDPT